MGNGECFQEGFPLGMGRGIGCCGSGGGGPKAQEGSEPEPHTTATNKALLYADHRPRSILLL